MITVVNTEVVSREFDVTITLEGIEYDAWGTYTHGHGFDTLEVTTDASNAGYPESGPYEINGNSPIYSAVRDEIYEWITSL